MDHMGFVCGNKRENHFKEHTTQAGWPLTMTHSESVARNKDLSCWPNGQALDGQ